MGAPGREMPRSGRQSDDGSRERREDHFLTRRRGGRGDERNGSRTQTERARRSWQEAPLRLTNQRVGLLINFGGNMLVDGLRRVVNDLPPSASPRLRVNQSARAQLCAPSARTGGSAGRPQLRSYDWAGPPTFTWISSSCSAESPEPHATVRLVAIIRGGPTHVITRSSYHHARHGRTQGVDYGRRAA